MNNEISLRKKYTFRVGDKKIVFIKKNYESEQHVMAKACCYALYGKEYPDIKVEVPVIERYKPDLVMTDTEGYPLFWAECGTVKLQKIRKLLKKYKKTHFVFLKYDKELRDFIILVKKEKQKAQHKLKVDIVKLPEKMGAYIDINGTLTIVKDNCDIYTVT